MNSSTPVCLVISAFALAPLPAFACQLTNEEHNQRMEQQKRDRADADAVVVGSVRGDDACVDWGQLCSGRLAVSEVLRGSVALELQVRFRSTESTCDLSYRLWPGSRPQQGNFYLEKIEGSGEYDLLDVDRFEASNR